MGEFHAAKFAYMVYTDENGVREGDPTKPTTVAIYKIPVKEVAAFQEKFNVAGARWVPVYSLMNWTDSTVLKEMDE